MNLKKSPDQSAIHLISGDREDYAVFTLDHDVMNSQGIFDFRADGTGYDSEPKYRMRIVPVEAIKDDLKVKGYESKWEVVKFQKCGN